MNIVWMTWKDPSHPDAGGAEIVQRELTTRLMRDGHTVIVVTARYEGASADSTVNGVRYLRGGSGRVGVYPAARQIYRRENLDDWADLVIDELNTLPFMAKWYVKRPRHVLFCHQLAREIWFYELPPYLGWIGWLAEPVYVRLLAGQPAITVSESTKNDLIRFGHKPEDIAIISEGLTNEPVENLDQVQKTELPTLLIHGSMRAMKRTLDGIKAFETAKKVIPNLQLKISGSPSGPYGHKILQYITQSSYKDSIEYVGRTTDEQKEALMQQCHAILVTSVREGWGLIVTEANSQGCPAVVYDVPGLRDSVRNNETGVITDPNPDALAAGITELLSDQKRYATLQEAGYAWSKAITFDQSYTDFKKAVKI